MKGISDLIKKKMDEMMDGKAEGSISVEVSEADEALEDCFDQLRSAIKTGDRKAGAQALRKAITVIQSDETDEYAGDDHEDF